MPIKSRIILPTIGIACIYAVYSYSLYKAEREAEILSHINKMSAPSDITLVTSFFNLGTFKKGGGQRESSDYFQWMTVFKRIKNPLVVYSDDEKFLRLIKSVRLNMTDRSKFILLNESEPQWAMSLEGRIKDVFSQPGYPKFNPDTTFPKYSCVMHSKYELVMRTVKLNYFQTPHFAWCDLGYFRLVSPEGDDLLVSLPPLFDNSRIAFNKINRMSPTDTPMDVVSNDKVWIGGGFFLGAGDLLIKFFTQYKLLLEELITNKTVASDQQALYSMYLPVNRPLTSVQLQLYNSRIDQCDYWFYLGHLSIRHGCALGGTNFVDTDY